MHKDENTLKLVEDHFQSGADWIELIKAIRMATGVGLQEAQDIALSHEGWRRLCNHRINHDPDCRKMARSHLRREGPNSLIAEDGSGRYSVRVNPQA